MTDDEKYEMNYQIHTLPFCMDFPMYFGFVYGILFDDRIITRKTRKSHRNTENKKNLLDSRPVVPSPAPTRNPRKSTEFTKRGQGRGEPIGSPLAKAGWMRSRRPQPSKSIDVRPNRRFARGRGYERISAVIETFLVFLDVLRFGVMDGMD